jgi:hypothetical protein
MERVATYRENANACRELARHMPEPQRKQLLGMALLWEQIANEREDAVTLAEPLKSR